MDQSFKFQSLFWVVKVVSVLNLKTKVVKKSDLMTTGSVEMLKAEEFSIRWHKGNTQSLLKRKCRRMRKSAKNDNNLKSCNKP